MVVVTTAKDGNGKGDDGSVHLNWTRGVSETTKGRLTSRRAHADANLGPCLFVTGVPEPLLCSMPAMKMRGQS